MHCSRHSRIMSRADPASRELWTSVSCERRHSRPATELEMMSSHSSTTSLSWHDFTSDEKRQIRRLWTAIDAKKTYVAQDIYEMIFNQCPEARRLFPKMKFVNSKPDRRNNEFTFQAMRFMQVIEAGVEALDNLSSLDVILDNLGRRHGKLEVNGKFRPYYWSTFLECSVFCVRKELTNSRKFANEDIDEAIVCFRTLLRDIMRKIKTGYNADICHRLTQMAINSEQRKMSVPTIHKNNSEKDFDELL
ncbi:unnamed protein product [Caenorhabditis auriculariae]|uniref:Globin domain-containing protein n=1 Tax=Caenorhabditis auriculariae TaxID=2777116 RepID=A0A8S1H744_9PELO|nr:unnamed protein product [Caenorhabditis auriculariae]